MTVAIPLGMAGALLGGLAGAVVAGELSMQLDERSLLMAMIASMAVLFSYRSYFLRWEKAPLGYPADGAGAHRSGVSTKVLSV